jgi:hypothetical protein
MPIHEWTRVEAGIFHDFHHAWIEEIKRELNARLLPGDYYAMAEQHAAGFGPDVLTLQSLEETTGDETRGESNGNGGTVLLAPPKVELTAETDMEFYRRKQNAVVVRHVSGDYIVAVVEIVSRGNKSGQKAFRAFVEKAAELLEQRIHLLIVDLYPPGSRDPNGIHGAIWEEITGEEYTAPADKPLTLVAYECALSTRAYIQPMTTGEQLIDMPLFLEPRAHVPVPLEATYQRAFAALPKRWRTVLDDPT